MKNLPPLNALRAFEAAGRHLTFRRAADELSVTQGAVAQQVRGLEERLKVKLFHREARGLALTDDGRRYLNPIGRAFRLIAEATEELMSSEAVVTISTTPSFAARWLAPRLGSLAQAHPELRVRLDATDRLATFHDDGVDIAIRLAREPFASTLNATPLFGSELIAVCHPGLADGTLSPSSPIETADDLAKHTLLEDAHGAWPLFWEVAFPDRSPPAHRSMRFSQSSLAIEAALAGQGVALSPRAFVETDLAAGRLRQAVPETLAASETYFVVSPKSPRRPSIVDDVRRWLTQTARETPAPV